MTRPNLYICHTAYQVLIAMVRAMREPVLPDLILSCVIPNTNELAGRLSASGLFRYVKVFDEEACGNAMQTGVLKTLLLQRWMGRRNVEKYYGFSLQPNQYQTIYIHNDWSVLGRYLQDLRASYVLCEDTMASTCKAEHPLIDEQRRLPFFALRQRLGYGYLYWGDYKWVTAVETECRTKTKLFPHKLVQDSKTERLHQLTDSEKALIRQVFLTQPLPQKAEGAVLLLPRDFVPDGLLDVATQQAMFAAVAAHYCQNGPLFIKAHPRDNFDYSTLFPNAIILERTMPSEVLNFALPFRFARAVTVESMVLKAFEVADEKIDLSLSEALQLL